MLVSKPRYDWWGYVKGMIRRYPELCQREAALHATAMSPDLSGMPHGSGGRSDPVADAALRELPEVNRREMEAVRRAVQQTRAMPDGEDRIAMVRMVFWNRTHTLDGAAMHLHLCQRTIWQWHGEFVRLVAKEFGLL